LAQKMVKNQPKNPVQFEIISFETDTQYGDCLARSVVSDRPGGT